MIKYAQRTDCASGTLGSGILSEVVRVVYGVLEDGCRRMGWINMESLLGEKLIIDVLF
jgi:hypothetical protein